MTNDHDHSVGYKRPPVATRFKPGVSGNPSGRPKEIKGLKTELLEELGEVIRISEGDSALEVSKARAIAKSLVRAAIDGNMRATIALLAFCVKNLGDAGEAQDQLATADDAEILNDYIDRELRRRASQHDVATDTPQLDSGINGSIENEK